MQDIKQLPWPIQEHIIVTTSKEFETRDNHVHVTELLYCLRKAYFRRQFLSIEKELEQRWYAYRGLIFDQLWTGLFDRNQVRVTYRIPDGPTIVGHIDFIYKTDNEPIIYELKTISNRFAIKEGPKEDHIKQVKFYAYCENIELAKLVYISFEGVKVYDIDCSDVVEVVNELVERAKLFYKALKEKKPPAKTDREWECRYCEFKAECEAIPGGSYVHP